jgi:hypothetical protein
MAGPARACWRWELPTKTCRASGARTGSEAYPPPLARGSPTRCCAPSGPRLRDRAREGRRSAPGNRGCLSLRGRFGGTRPLDELQTIARSPKGACPAKPRCSCTRSDRPFQAAIVTRDDGVANRSRPKANAARANALPQALPIRSGWSPNPTSSPGPVTLYSSDVRSGTVSDDPVWNLEQAGSCVRHWRPRVGPPPPS